MLRSKKIGSIAGLAAAGTFVTGSLLFIAVPAMAGSNIESYSTTVGRLNGSGYTGNQTKEYNTREFRIFSKTVGGTYVVDVRAQRSDGSGSGPWIRNLTDNDNRGLPNSISQQTRVRIQFSNDANTPVRVQVDGTWQSN